MTGWWQQPYLPSEQRGSMRSSGLKQIVLYVTVVFLGTNQAARPSPIGPQNETSLTVTDPRPVAKAIGLLEARFGWQITYEDPPFEYEGDVADLTVRRDLGRALVPKEGRIEISYSTAGEQPPIPRDVLQAILDDHEFRGNAGKFVVKSTGPVYHVIPAGVKDRRGVIRNVNSILDLRISLPKEDRNINETLQAICQALSRESGVTVGLASAPINILLSFRSEDGATDESARDVLLRSFAVTKTKLVWALLYDPGLKVYALNIHRVMKEEKTPTGRVRRVPVP